MESGFKEEFQRLWKKYFDGAELPIAFFYTDDEDVASPPLPADRCLIANLARVRKGTPMRFGNEAIACAGGRRYTGFAETLMPNFEYFLSCGIPGKMAGERYKKSPELVREFLAKAPRFRAPKKYLVFKRWDRLEAKDVPEVVVFFARPDVLSGLMTLASFDTADESGVIAPFGAGCGSIVLYPWLEKDKPEPRGVIGMFDPSARPHVPADILTFAAPMTKFLRMVENAEESFLTTPTWDVILKRIMSTGA
ncbi:MAG: DUF169 domain-containing protein [Candidatus Aminicenantales bacterium]